MNQQGPLQGRGKCFDEEKMSTAQKVGYPIEGYGERGEMDGIKKSLIYSGASFLKKKLFSNCYSEFLRNKVIATR